MKDPRTAPPQLDRFGLIFKPLSERKNKRSIARDFVALDSEPARLSPQQDEKLSEIAERIVAARAAGASVMLAFGAHAIKNGLGLIFKDLIERGWLTHLATNGAGIIHDWEFAFQGMTSEDVREYIREGQFGLWQETGFFINLAINLGSYYGRGYGDSVGSMICEEKLNVPSRAMLEAEVKQKLQHSPSLAAAAAELSAVVKAFGLEPGEMKVAHPWKAHSVQAAAFSKGIPFTGHPMIGHDIIYTHPMNDGMLLGAAAQRDFLSFAEGVNRLQDGVYLSVGSAVMSPMIFEKSLSMARNAAKRDGRTLNDFQIVVADLAPSAWDWSRGEPPETDPAYYHRFNKTFSRMGGTHTYLSMDNRDFLLSLRQKLKDKRLKG